MIHERNIHDIGIILAPRNFYELTLCVGAWTLTLMIFSVVLLIVNFIVSLT